MRLAIVRDALDKKKVRFEYAEEDGCGSLDFIYKGLKYHVWEFLDGEWGAETNVFRAGHTEDVTGDYEKIIADEIMTWPDLIVPD